MTAKIKIGPVERIRQLVNAAMPGIAIKPLPVAPRQIPYRSGYAYFELEKRSQFWKELQNSGGFALHIGDRKSTRLNSSHVAISYAVFCLKKKKKRINYE